MPQKPGEKILGVDKAVNQHQKNSPVVLIVIYLRC